MPTPKKNETIQEIRDRFENATSMIFTDFSGITVEQISAFRRKLRDCKAEYRIFKNTLTRIAIQDKPYGAEVAKHLEGTTAVLIGTIDPVAPLKALKEFEKTKAIPIKIGVVEGKAFGTAELAKIRELPSPQQLRGMLLGALQAPARNLLSLLSAPSRNLLSVLKQKADKAA